MEFNQEEKEENQEHISTELNLVRYFLFQQVDSMGNSDGKVIPEYGKDSLGIDQKHRRNISTISVTGGVPNLLIDGEGYTYYIQD